MENNSLGRKQLAKKLLEEIEKIFPDAKTELENWETPFQFLVCIILSAQTTDKQVNKITGKLFDKYPNSSSFAKAKYEEVENLVKSVNYYKTKAKHLLQTAKIISERYEGYPPKDLIKLQELPGVGYKTANVFLNDLYHANQGVAVDTHVARVALRYGLTESKNPDKIAKDLEEIYPKGEWYKVNKLFVLYGRYILKAQKPDYEKVVMKKYLRIPLS
jgi:endonuclease-3